MCLFLVFGAVPILTHTHTDTLVREALSSQHRAARALHGICNYADLSDSSDRIVANHEAICTREAHNRGGLRGFLLFELWVGLHVLALIDHRTWCGTHGVPHHVRKRKKRPPTFCNIKVWSKTIILNRFLFETCQSRELGISLFRESQAILCEPRQWKSESSPHPAY